VPEIEPDEILLEGAGWDNTIYRVNREWVFRFPRRALAAPLMETELVVAGLLKDRFEIPTAFPRFPCPRPPEEQVHPEDDFPWSFAGYDYLSGITTIEDPVPMQRRGASIDSMARFLKVLHGIDVTPGLRARLLEDPLGRWKGSRMIPVIRRELEFLEREGLPVDRGRLEELLDPSVLDWEPSADQEPDRSEHAPHLVHGDLHTANLLFDPSGKLSGILDFGDIHLGHPARDLGLLPMFFPEPTWDAFFGIYGAVDDLTMSMAKLRALRIAVAFSDQGRDTGRKGLASESIRILQILRVIRVSSKAC